MRSMRLAVVALAAVVSMPASGATITFDDVVTGQTSYGFDGDGDTIDDVIFSTTDPLGFNTIGPGANQQFIDEPGLEGTTLLNPDLRVDFVFGATTSLQFGFAVNGGALVPNVLTFSVYDGANNLLGSSVYTATRGTSSFPEGLAVIAFGGTAAYGIFNFNDPGVSRYIIDNFTGNFGSVEAGVPEPATWAMMIAGFGLVGGSMRSRRRGLAIA